MSSSALPRWALALVHPSMSAGIIYLGVVTFGWYNLGVVAFGFLTLPHVCDTTWTRTYWTPYGGCTAGRTKSRLNQLHGRRRPKSRPRTTHTDEAAMWEIRGETDEPRS